MNADRKRKAKPRLWTDKDGLKARVGEWCGKIGVQVREVHVRDMCRKWASISSDGGRLTLDSGLLREKPEFCDYVIVHDLLHLRVPNHGKLFKALMGAHLPGWERHARSAGDGSRNVAGRVG